MTWHGGVPFESLGMDTEKYGLLKELAEDGGYWKSSLSFIEGVRGRNPSQLTVPQRNWLSRIIESLGSELATTELDRIFDESQG